MAFAFLMVLDFFVKYLMCGEHTMRVKLLNWLRSFAENFWLVPLLFMLAATGLALLNTYLDEQYFAGDKIALSHLLYFNDLDSVRALLGTIAGSVLGVAGVSFSITIASLTLASQQFGPRLLRNFMSDRFNQVVIGTFLATFLYCLLLLQFTSAADEVGYVPIISMLTALFLIVVNLLMLVFFIHHISTVIQADNLIIDVHQELVKHLQRNFPTTNDGGNKVYKEQLPDDALAQLERQGKPFYARRSGYFQALDDEGLIQFAANHDLIVQLNYKQGDYVIQGTPFGKCLGAHEMDDELENKLLSFFIVGSLQTADQDTAFAMRQLIEIGVRALSTGINDPFTAVACIDRLGDAMAYVMNKAFPQGLFFDQDGHLRVQLQPDSFGLMLDNAFSQIRQNSEFHVVIVVRLLNTMEKLAVQVRNSEQAHALLTQVNAIYQDSLDGIPAIIDQERVQGEYERVIRTLDASGFVNVPADAMTQPKD